ncbi:hypothetical protein [Flavobacterium psychrophilum]|nr:hypothetical protein [Flavobacterium psychrophilum]SNA80288.1 hypothetical protein FI146_340005 [Flavobacterium psychrophilum]SNB13508.1 hypothetical protein JIP1600_2250002 [Flavobacterium psychrophilum]
MKIVTLQKVYNLTDATSQIRVKMFSKVVFKFSFKPTLNTI